MSKQTSLVTFEGKMGNLSFFKSKGVNRARMRGGLSRERIQSDPKLKRIRENNSEFKGLSETRRSFRRAISMAAIIADGELLTRMAKVFTVMKKRSLGIRGERPVLISQQRVLLRDIELNAAQNFLTAFGAPYTASHEASRLAASVSIPDIAVGDVVRGPASATHFRLVQLLGTVSDTAVNVDMGSYSPVQPAVNGLSVASFSDYHPVDSVDPLSVTIDTTLPAAALPAEGVTVIQCLGIIFYENIGTEYYPLTQGMAMKIVDVF